VVEHTAGPAAATGWRRAAGVSYLVIAALVVLSVFVQFLLAGLGVFGAESFQAHKDFGGVFHLLALLLVVLALLVRRNRLDLILVIMLFVLITVQFALADADDKTVAAFHVVNALVIYTAAYHVLQRALRSMRARPAV
jgi:mercuric ion transport protein